MPIIDNTTHDALHTLVVKVLSKYDVSDKDVQKFIKVIAKDIRLKSAKPGSSSNNNINSVQSKNPLLNLSPDTKSFFEKIFDNREQNENTTPLSQTKESTTLQKLLKTFIERNTTKEPSQPERITKPTSIVKDVFKQKDILGVGYELFKKRQSETDNKQTSYFKDLISAFKKDGITGLKKEAFAVKEAPEQKPPIQQKNSNPQQYQTLDYIKDEQAEQVFKLDGFTENGKTSLTEILNDSLKNLTSFTKQTQPNENTPTNKQGFDILSLLKLRKPSYIPRRTSPRTTTRQTTRRTSRAPKSPSNKPAKTRQPAPPSSRTPSPKIPTSSAEPIRTTSKLPTAKGTEKAAAKGTEKAAAKAAAKAVTKGTEKAVAKGTEKVITKGTEKAVAKTAAKTVGKSIIKKIPLVGLAAGGVFAAQRALQGDWSGAGLELASGAAGTVPGFGTAASIGLDAALAARDITAAQPSTSPPSPPLPVQSNTTPPQPATALPPPEQPTKYTPIQSPPQNTTPSFTQPEQTQSAPATPQDNNVLKQIANNTDKTNTQIATLAQSILKLASAISQNSSNKKNFTIPPPSPQPPPQLPPAAEIANNNVDPIRIVRSKFMV
jgi:hypothetical protein